MKKAIILIITCVMLQGCSLLPRLSFDTPNTVAQSVNKSKAKEVCKGKAKWGINGNITSCSKGYVNYEVGYKKQERKMTIVERVKSFFNKIFGWGIPGLIIICGLFPGAFTIIGAIAGRLFEGAFGAGRIVLKRVAKAVQKVRKEGADLETELNAKLDEADKDYIKKLKNQENIK